MISRAKLVSSSLNVNECSAAQCLVLMMDLLFFDKRGSVTPAKTKRPNARMNKTPAYESDRHQMPAPSQTPPAKARYPTFIHLAERKFRSSNTTPRIGRIASRENSNHEPETLSFAVEGFSEESSKHHPDDKSVRSQDPRETNRSLHLTSKSLLEYLVNA